MEVMMPACSPGSNQAGAMEMCTAHVRVPSGAAAAGADANAAISAERTTARSTRRDDSGGVMRNLHDEEVPDYLRMVRAVNMRQPKSQPGKLLSCSRCGGAGKR